MSDYFEGPEKKVELVARVPLRELGDDFWRGVVRTANAEVLSILRSAECDAFLLSESSLFVFENHITMITCGRTRLVDAVEFVVQRIGAANVALLMYERKNEHFPERQPTSFYEDALRLKALTGGQALRFGDESGHHVHLFHSPLPYEVHEDDTTLEILMHGIPADVARRFVGCEAGPGRTLAEEFGITSILPGYQIDEHAFTPAGYSMNGLSGENYYTVHVTPERIGSYVSFETNADFRTTLPQLVANVVEVFRPRSFDVMAFVPEADGAPTLELDAFAGVRIRDRVATRVHGYRIHYWNGYRPIPEAREPFVVPLEMR